MNNMDAHSCGACGYDGGLEHSKKVTELNNELIRLEAKNSASGAAKLTFLAVALVTMCVTGVISWDSYIAPPAQITETHIHADPLASAYAEIGKAYSDCLDEAVDSLDRQNCNLTFVDTQSKVYNLLEKFEEKKHGDMVHE